jgi:membrane peptidoglycan carboxypeptidase
VTPIQLAAAMGAVANDGVYNPPYLVESILSADRQRIATERPTGEMGSRRAVSAQAARTLRQILRSVTADGTGKAARVPGYTTGGKTGTAQKIEPGGRGYARGHHVAWFAGFVPADKPELVIVVMVDEPKGPLFHGGDVAAPVFSRVAQPVLEYLGVPPDGEGALTVDPMLRASLAAPAGGDRAGGARTGTPIGGAQSGGRLAGGMPAGAPAAVPAKNTRTLRGGETRAAAPGMAQAGMLAGVVPTLTDGSTMPNLSGMSLRQASEALAALGLNCTSQRAGPRVVRQQPEPGVPVRAGDRCAVVYE